jgi:hypothetical protein
VPNKQAVFMRLRIGWFHDRGFRRRTAKKGWVYRLAQRPRLRVM